MFSTGLNEAEQTRCLGVQAGVTYAGIGAKAGHEICDGDGTVEGRNGEATKFGIDGEKLQYAAASDMSSN